MRFDGTWTTATVRQIRDLTANIREIVLAPDSGAGRYPTGAHLIVRVMIDGRQDVRHYSLVGDSPSDGCWRIAVKLEAAGRGGSKYMWSLRPGARIEVSSPGSSFELSHDAPDYLLMAGGIGITPLRGMATVLARRNADFRMIYGGRSRAEMAYADELAAELGERLELAPDDGGPGIDIAAAFARLSPHGEAYVCGPLGLLESARRSWAEAGRTPAKLIFESFGSSGRLAAEPFVVRVPRLGLELQVPASATMLDVLEAAGVEILCDCRRGECGLCAMEVIEFQGDIDHRDVFFSDHEHRENRRICACVSRVAGGHVTVEPALRGDAPFTPGGAAPKGSVAS
jgi:ferredoxin-NADP reductase